MRQPTVLCASAWRRNWIRAPLVILALTIATITAARADSFGPVYYNPRTNEILVIIYYRGTNPNHYFSIQWRRCRKLHGQLHGRAPRAINLGILDDQGNDAARRPYTKLVKVPLTGVSCLPATVTLWTSPNQYQSIKIP